MAAEVNNSSIDTLSLEEFRRLAVSIYATAIPAMIALCAAAFAANVLVLISVKFVRIQLNPTLKLAFSLSAADAWTSLIIAVGLVANSYYPTVKQVKFYRQDCIVYALEAMRTGAMVTSVLHLLILSLTHYTAIAFPMVYRDCTFHRKRINVLIAFLWIAPPLGFLVTFFAYFDQTFNAVKCTTKFLNKMGFRITVFMLMFIPLTLMTAVYVKIVWLLSALKSKTHSPSGQKSPTAAAKLNPNPNASQRREVFLQRKVRTVVTGMLIVSTFLIGWIPSSVLFALTCESCLYPMEKILFQYPRSVFTLTITVNCLIIIKGLLNPLIYCIRIPEISDALKIAYGRFLCCCDMKRKKPSSLVTYEVSTFGDMSVMNPRDDEETIDKV